MRIGLIDVDGHNFPNLALMRISAWHKSQGDTVEWWETDFIHYDKVYMSKVFSDAYTPDVPEPINADEVIKGGSGYCISLGPDGREVYDRSRDRQLPQEMEHMFPDYSIYPQYDFAVAMTSRGCPRGCAFCHVAAKEGRCSVKVADVSDFWHPGEQKEIKILDPNILACRDKRDLMRQYRETGCILDFNQGLDIRLMDDEDIRDINSMRFRYLHFAWDNHKDHLEDKFQHFAKSFRRKSDIGMVYCLTNFGSTLEEDLHRIYTLRGMGYDPFVMIYDKPNAPEITLELARWCNNKYVFKRVPDFNDYCQAQRNAKIVKDQMTFADLEE